MGLHSALRDLGAPLVQEHRLSSGHPSIPSIYIGGLMPSMKCRISDFAIMCVILVIAHCSVPDDRLARAATGKSGISQCIQLGHDILREKR